MTAKACSDKGFTSSNSSRNFHGFELLGCPLQLITKFGLLDLIHHRLAHGRQTVVANQNLHGMALLRRDAELSDFFRDAEFCYIDGMPLVWLARLCGLKAHSVHRNTHLDWMPDLLKELAAEHRSLFFLGGTKKTVELVQRYLAETYPLLRVEAHHGYFPAGEEGDVQARINQFNPDVLVVGMGMPLQELWLHRNREHLCFGVAIPSGAIFDYLVGVQKTPPRLSGRLGLEGLVRLLHDPMRLGHRYLIEPWTLLLPAIKDLLRYRFREGKLRATVCRDAWHLAIDSELPASKWRRKGRGLP